MDGTSSTWLWWPAVSGNYPTKHTPSHTQGTEHRENAEASRECTEEIGTQIMRAGQRITERGVPPRRPRSRPTRIALSHPNDSHLVRIPPWERNKAPAARLSLSGASRDAQGEA